MADKRKNVGFVFIERYADWEFGFLSAAVAEYMGGRTIALSPDGRPVSSIGGLHLTAARGLKAEENQDLDAVAVIGSDNWTGHDAPDVSPLLNAVHVRGGVVGGICAGTLAIARSGLFAGRKHTSNGKQWITEKLIRYDGLETYQDVPYAVADDRVVSAPGSAPGTFATAFLKSLYPDQEQTIDGMRQLFAREYQAP
ncbi:MAG: DJ-1/PfpI family protein [Phyllobacterium sp.]